MAAVVDTYLKWPTSRKALLWFVLSALILGIYYFFVLLPQLDRLQSLESEFDQLGQKLRESQAIAANLPRVQKEVELLDQKLAEALTKLPNSEEIPALLQTVSDLGKDAGLEFLLFKPGGATPKDFYAEVPLELQIKGRYHDMGLFFNKIGRLPRIVTIRDLDLGKPTPGPGGVELTANCKAVTFKFLDPSQQVTAENKKGGKKK
jgi:type IV pilus assembly protein PilO